MKKNAFFSAINLLDGFLNGDFPEFNLNCLLK